MRVEIELQSARERSLFELKSKMFAQAKTKFNRFELLTWESKPPFLRSLLRSLACFELNLKLYILFEPKVCRLKQKKLLRCYYYYYDYWCCCCKWKKETKTSD